MPLKRLGKPPYLLPDEVENNDLVEIIDKPYIVPAEQTKWGKERGKAAVRIVRTGDERRWTLNATTWDRLLDVFGDDPDHWLGKKVKIKKEMRTISGVTKQVLFGVPHRETQQPLNVEPQKPGVEQQIAEYISKLSSESRQGLLEHLQEVSAQAET